MKIPFFFFISLMLFLGCQEAPDEADTSTSTGPDAKQVEYTFTEFGQDRKDPYQWLSNPEDPEVISVLEAENAHVEKMLSHTKELQEEIYNELIERIEKKYESLPTKENGYWYYVRYDEDNEYPYICRKKESLEADEEIILNVNEMAEGFAVYRLFNYFVSPNNQYVAFLVDTSGDRRNTLYFKDLTTGKLLADQVGNCSYPGAWAKDNKTFFYSVNDKTVRSYQVRRHELGTSVEKDISIYTEPDSTFTAWVNKSSDSKYILVSSSSTTTSEWWYMPADQPTSDLKVVQERQIGLEYSVNSYYDDKFYIQHNLDAKNFMISTAPINSPGKDSWTTLIPHRPGIYLNYYSVRENYLILQERTEALDKIHVINRTSGEEHYLDFGEEVYTSNMFDPTDEFGSDSIRYNFQSLTTPSSTFGYNLASKEKKY